MQPVIIIPAYKPEAKLIDLAQTLTNEGHQLIVVNDGSGEEFNTIFDKVKSFPNVTLLKHAVNLGKGQALKTAFNHFLNNFEQNSAGVVTADADGQHLAQDINALANKLVDMPSSLWLGAREFRNDIPFRSRFGNIVTRHIFKFFIGKNITDTQTGLRAIPSKFLRELLQTQTNGYDFELDMLIKATQHKIDIQETPIATVYEDGNKSSHFNPITDSFKIYFVFFRFLIFAILSGVIDFVAFYLTFSLIGHVGISETLSRVISGTCNFFFNKKLVFKSSGNLLPQALRYILLCMLNLVFSISLIYGLVYFGIHVYISKLIALLGLFIANFSIQRVLVFTDNSDEDTSISLKKDRALS